MIVVVAVAVAVVVAVDEAAAGTVAVDRGCRCGGFYGCARGRCRPRTWWQQTWSSRGTSGQPRRRRLVAGCYRRSSLQFATAAAAS